MNQHIDVRVNGERLWQSIMDIAEIGPGTEGGSRRLALTDEDCQGRNLFAKWCEEAGCRITVDDMGNMFAVRPGAVPDLPPVMAGSHLDTQPHGGRFDGIYGVLAALEVVRSLNDANITTNAPIAIVNWTNEEGSRFAPAMIASGVYAKLFEKTFAYSRTDSEGKTLRDELERIGYLGEQPCGSQPIGALIEAHIEQGPILERVGHQIGIVTGGQGQRWFDVTIKGQDSHAGSTPMAGRKDALVAASKLITAVRNIALDFPPHGVGTVGEMSVFPSSRNTIPGEVFLTVDIRNPERDVLMEMKSAFMHCCQQIREAEGVSIEITEIWDKAPVKFNKQCVDAVRDAAIAMDYRHQDIVSGAGHDACQVCEVAPTAMIFVPCEGGLSHNEKENASPEDLEAGCNVLLHAMLALSKADKITL